MPTRGILGNTEVTDVHEKNDVIFHSVTAPLEVGSIVSGKINWKERLRRCSSIQENI